MKLLPPKTSRIWPKILTNTTTQIYFSAARPWGNLLVNNSHCLIALARVCRRFFSKRKLLLFSMKRGSLLCMAKFVRRFGVVAAVVLVSACCGGGTSDAPSQTATVAPTTPVVPPTTTTKTTPTPTIVLPPKPTTTTTTTTTSTPTSPKDTQPKCSDVCPKGMFIKDTDKKKAGCQPTCLTNYTCKPIGEGDFGCFCNFEGKCIKLRLFDCNQRV